MMFKGICRIGNSWGVEIQAAGTVYILTLDEAWKLALEIIQAIKAHYS